MERFNGKCIYPYVSDIQFRLLKVSKNFNPESSFSDVDVTLASIRSDKGSHLYVRLDRLFKFDPDLLSFPEKRLPSMRPAIARLVSVLKHCRGENLEDRLMELKRAAQLSDVTEKLLVVNLIKHLLVPLFGPVDVEKGYGSLVEQVGLLGPDVTLTDLGVGGVHTWHGSTEVRVKGCPAIVTLEGLGGGYEENSDGETDDADIPEQSVSFEGKIRSRKRHIGQLVKTCVVNAFTEANLNPDLDPVVPTILFNRSSYRLCLYDCQNDVLLLSEPKNLTTRGGLSRTGALLLWLTVNHRSGMTTQQQYETVRVEWCSTALCLLLSYSRETPVT